jgi:YVTN family beta-propeller protein
LYVAELGNDTVGVIDLKERKTVHTITGLRGPQGIGYVSSTDTVYVANAGDGSVRLFQGVDLAPAGEIPLGDDADNVRVDETGHRVFVGYASGALAVIDKASRTKIADIPLKAHPESFQLESAGQHNIIVNVPDAHEIALVDLATNKQIADWPTNDLRANFALAIEETRHRILAVFRNPSKVGVFNDESGRLLTTLDTCQDADDVFLDAKRRHVYVSCEEGYVDVFGVQGEGYMKVGHIATAAGARTSLWVPAIDRLLLAVRASASEPAAIWVFRPVP